MATQVSSSLEETNGQQQLQTKSWSWSIRPLILWMRILGIDLPDASPNFPSRHHRWLFYVYQVICFSSHAISQVNIVYWMAFERDQISGDSGFSYETVTATWNWIIDFINYAIYGIGIHLMLLTVIRRRWNRLRNNFHRHFQMVSTSDENYVRIRRISSFCVAYVILVISGMIIVTLIHLTMNGSSALRFFITITSTLSVLYPATTLIIFAVHCYASSLAFELIQEKIQRRETSPTNGRDLCLFVITLKHNYVAVCDSIDAIGHCFGGMLLVSTVFVFVAVINSTFYFSSAKINVIDHVFLCFTLSHATQMCFSADRIRDKAKDVIKEFLRLTCDGSSKEYQMEMEFLIWDMTQAVPQISANGYFNISKGLFPQLIGTTSTYFFILCQFQASEKKPISY